MQPDADTRLRKRKRVTLSSGESSNSAVRNNIDTVDRY